MSEHPSMNFVPRKNWIIGLFWAVAAITALCFLIAHTANGADDHKPVKVPQPVIEWAKAEFSSGVGENAIGVRLVVASGVTVMRLDKDMHVRYVDPDWCEREFGHAWITETVLSLNTIACYDDGELTPCPPPPTRQHCRICKLRRVRSADTWTYERPKQP